MNHRRALLAVAICYLTATTIATADTFPVINTNDTGPGSLRQAITDANNHLGLDTIAFNIPGTGAQTITPLAVLPTIIDPVIVDGYTQPGASPNTLANGDNAVLLVELNGSGLSNAKGLVIDSGGSTVRGLVINRFGSDAIEIHSNGNLIEGNFIGTNAAGTSALPNGNGIVAGFGGSPSNNMIGGTTPAARNLISGNTAYGVSVDFSGNVVQGNFIGIDVTGVAALGNGDSGVFVGGSGNTVGGATAAARNIISANGRGVQFNGTGHFLQGNFIGTDVTGTIARPNQNEGVNVNSATNVIIGGLTSNPGLAPGNLISGNIGIGLDLFAGSNNNQIQGNIIGADVMGTNPLGNSLAGVSISGSGNTVGGSNGSARNIIAFNGTSPSNGIGIAVTNNESFVNNALLGNSIFSNTGLGIDLIKAFDGPGGVTPNDAGDIDTGANNLQNFPVLHSVANSGGMTTITGTLNSMANMAYRLEFFANDGIDPSGYGEGKIFLGFVSVTTNSSGDGSFNASFPQIGAGQHVTATATDPNGNTSEFCAAIGQLLNISTRLRVQTNENVLIGGFIITGTDPKRVIVRAIGPSLSQLFTDFLADPTLELHGPAGFVTITNDNWKTRSDGGSQQAEIEATGLAPTNDLESALVQTLPANNAGYTAIVRGKNDTTGIGLVEAYDLDTSANSNLANISTRGFVETGNNVLIGGFIAGNGVTKVIVRAIGPSLTGSGVAGALQDPTLELHDGSGTLIASDDNWRTGGQEAEIIATGIPPTNDLESAIVATLAPGADTVIVAGKITVPALDWSKFTIFSNGYRS
jgi:hypothetical protein